MSQFDRGCVKTQTKTKLRKIDVSERATLNDQGLGNSKRTPQNRLTLRFYTAWAGWSLNLNEQDRPLADVGTTSKKAFSSLREALGGS